MISEKMNALFENKKAYCLILVMLFALALFLRVYKIESIPDVIHYDEGSLGYNAWCIAHYGTDRFGNEMPIYVQNKGSGQSPLYTYLTAFLIATVGQGECPLWLLRLPAVIFSMLTVLFGSRLIHLICQNRKITLASMVFLTISPYFIMSGRYALDCNLMLGCCTVSLYLLMRYLSSGKLSHLILSGISFGITLYSYVLSYLVLPVFLITFSLYLLYLRKISIRQILIWALSVCITALPIILYIISLLFSLSPFRFLWFTIAPVSSSRSSELGLQDFWLNIFEMLRGMLTSGNFPLEIVDKYYSMYYLSIPFIFLGFALSAYHFFKSLRSRSFHPASVFVLFTVAGLVTVGLVHGGGVYPPYRGNCLFIAFMYYAITGMLACYRFLKHYRRFFGIALAGCYMWWFAAFCRYYFTMYSVAETVSYPDNVYYFPSADAMEYVEALSYDCLYLDFAECDAVYYYLNPVAPDEFPDDHIIFNINYNSTELLPGNVYMISHPNNTEFLARVNACSYSWECTEFAYFNVYYIPADE